MSVIAPLDLSLRNGRAVDYLMARRHPTSKADFFGLTQAPGNLNRIEDAERELFHSSEWIEGVSEIPIQGILFGAGLTADIYRQTTADGKRSDVSILGRGRILSREDEYPVSRVPSFSSGDFLITSTKADGRALFLSPDSVLADPFAKMAVYNVGSDVQSAVSFAEYRVRK